MPKITHFFRRYVKRLRRSVKKLIYRFLVAIHEGEIRISMFYIVCTMCLLFLGIGFFFRTDTRKDVTTTASVFGSELTHALRHTQSQSRRAEPDADITLFLLPDTEDDNALSSFLNAPLYGFYLTGKEVSYLPEFYTSLSESFVAGTPYIGGLSFSYNPRRLLYNRATDIALLNENGTYSPLSEDALYYVVGTEAVFGMFHYLSERTFHLMDICPKGADGSPITDYSIRLLRGAEGSLTISSVYESYLLYDSSDTIRYHASDILRCDSLNTPALLSQLNIAGYFLVGCTLLFVTLAAVVRPPLHRIMIWFRIFLFHQKKRGKFSLRSRIYTIRTPGRRAA